MRPRKHLLKILKKKEELERQQKEDSVTNEARKIAEQGATVASTGEIKGSDRTPVNSDLEHGPRGGKKYRVGEYKNA